MLESQLLEIKSVLKTQKQDVANLVKELENEGRELAKRYERIQLETIQLNSLPSDIQNLETSIAELKQQAGNHDDGEDNGDENRTDRRNMNLSLEKTQAMVGVKEAELEGLDRELAALQSSLPRKRREWERLEAELQPLEARRATSVAGAREARRRKEEGLGGGGDELEERGKWWRSVEVGVKEMLGVEN